MQHPSLLLTVFAFLLVLGPLVLLHELGHYLVGRIFGVKADVFSIGFGREIFGWTDRKGTRWKVSTLPLGGYVQFAGDMNAASAPDSSVLAMSAEERAHCFHLKPLWQRSLIVLAGPVANLLVAVAIFAAFNMAYGRIEAQPQVASFTENSPAQDAGLHQGDVILSVNDEVVDSFGDIRAMVAPYPGKVMRIGIKRGSQHLSFEVPLAAHVEQDEFGNEARVGFLGIGAGEVRRVPVGPVRAVTLAFGQCYGVMGTMVTGIRQILAGERSVRELGGPVKIAQYSGEQLTLGWLNFVDFAALISINLAFINLLPIPTLDGGHLAFYAAEAVRRKPLDIRSQEWAFRAGLAFVLALMLFVTLNDIASLHLLGR